MKVKGLVECILAIDVGTTQTKAVLVSTQNGNIIATASHTNTLTFPQPEHVEQEPNQIWESVRMTAKAVQQDSKASSAKIIALTFSAQMTGIIPLDNNGKPLMRFLTWLDTRAAPLVPKMVPGLIRIKRYGIRRLLKFLKITGGVPSFTGKDVISKHFWLKHERPDIYKKAAKIIDTKDYCIFKATNQYVTSTDLAAVTWLMDTRQGRSCWSEDIFSMLRLDSSKMASIQPTTATVGELVAPAAKELGIPEGIPVVNGAGDIMAAAIGSGAIRDGDLSAVLGTSGWVACHCPERCRDLGLYTGTVFSANPNRFLILCKQETSGGSLEWVKNILSSEEAATSWKEIDEQVSKTLPGADDLFFLPWLTGERAPIDDHFMRGVFYNLSLHHTRSQLLRATYEGIAYNLRWALDAVEKVRSKKIKSPTDTIRLIGGGAKSDIWMQIIADTLNKKVQRVFQPQDATAHGAALTAMVGLNILPNFDAIIPLIKVDQVFQPNEENVAFYSQRFKHFKEIYAANKSVHERLNI
jgi:xylulokinase